jgi:RNA polymerase sigma factor (sigma-70 family)
MGWPRQRCRGSTRSARDWSRRAASRASSSASTAGWWSSPTPCRATGPGPRTSPKAFLRAHRDWPRVGGYRYPGAWVRRVAVNLATSAVRRRLIEARALGRLWARQEPALAELPASGTDFWRAVRSLPRRQVQAVALHYLEDLPVAEIARVLGCAEGTVKAHLHHGREALGRRLALFEERGP